MTKPSAKFRIEGEDATAAAFRSALGAARGTADTIEKAFKGAFAGVGGEVGRLGQQLGGIKNLLGVGGIAGAAGLVTMGFTKVVEQVKAAREEHERINDLAERLNLPTSQVRLYGDSWERVAVQMNDVARGFAELGKVQIKAFDAFDLDPAAAGAVDKARARIAAAAGDKQDKIDTLRILTGLSYEEAAKELEAEMKRLASWVSVRRDGKAYWATAAQAEGLEFGKEDISFLRRSGAILSPNELRDMEQLEAAMKKLEESRIKLLEKSGRAEDELTEIIGAGFKIRTDAMEAYYDGLDRETMTSTEKQLARLDEVESALKELRDAGRISAEVYRERWLAALDDVLQEVEVTAQYVARGVTPAVEELPDHALRAADRAKWAFQEAFFDPVNVGIKGLGRELVDTLRAAIAEGLADKLFSSKASGGLGWGDVIGGFVAGLIPGFADGGRPMVGRASIVGERGPELFVPDTAGTIVPNHRLGGASVTIVQHNDFRGATPDVMKALPSILDAWGRRTVDAARAAVRDDFNRRGYIR